MAGFVKGFGCRPLTDVAARTEAGGRRPKASKEGNRGKWRCVVQRLYVADCLANEQIVLSSEENGEPVWALGA